MWSSIVHLNSAWDDLIEPLKGVMHIMLNRANARMTIAAWPLPRRPSWVDNVNSAQTEAEAQTVRGSVQRGCPFGDEPWTGCIVREMGLESTLRPQGRPKNPRTGS
jgi:hypothetical protein